MFAFFFFPLPILFVSPSILYIYIRWLSFQDLCSFSFSSMYYFLGFASDSSSHLFVYAFSLQLFFFLCFFLREQSRARALLSLLLFFSVSMQHARIAFFSFSTTYLPRTVIIVFLPLMVLSRVFVLRRTATSCVFFFFSSFLSLFYEVFFSESLFFYARSSPFFFSFLILLTREPLPFAPHFFSLTQLVCMCVWSQREGVCITLRRLFSLPFPPRVVTGRVLVTMYTGDYLFFFRSFFSFCVSSVITSAKNCHTSVSFSCYCAFSSPHKKGKLGSKSASPLFTW